MYSVCNQGYRQRGRRLSGRRPRMASRPCRSQGVAQLQFLHAQGPNWNEARLFHFYRRASASAKHRVETRSRQRCGHSHVSPRRNMNVKTPSSRTCIRQRFRETRGQTRPKLKLAYTGAARSEVRMSVGHHATKPFMIDAGIGAKNRSVQNPSIDPSRCASIDDSPPSFSAFQ